MLLEFLNNYKVIHFPVFRGKQFYFSLVILIKMIKSTVKKRNNDTSMKEMVVIFSSLLLHKIHRIYKMPVKDISS